MYETAGVFIGHLLFYIYIRTINQVEVRTIYLRFHNFKRIGGKRNVSCSK